MDDSSSNNNYEDMRNRNIAELKSSLKEILGTDNISVNSKGKNDLKRKTGKKTPQNNNKTDLLTATGNRIAATARILAAQKIATKSKLKTAVKSSSNHDIPGSDKYNPEAKTSSDPSQIDDCARDSEPFEWEPTYQSQWSANSKTVPTVVKPASTSVDSAALKEAALLKLSKSQQSSNRQIIIEKSNRTTLLEPADLPITSKSLQHALNGIWSAIESLTKKQELIILTQSNIETKVDKLLRNLRATDSCKKPVDWPKELPLQSLQNIYKFELSLNEAEFMEFAINYFSTCGGKTSEELARAVCISLFSKSLASNINLKGTIKKTGIKNMQILKMIMDACKLALNKKFELKNATAAVGVWLRNQSCAKEDKDGEDSDDYE